MPTRKSLFFVILALVTLFMLWLLSDQRQKAGARSEYYTNVLTQAPCVASICPGYIGRQQAKENLSNTIGLKRVVDNGGAPVSFTFTSHEVPVRGGGALIFTIDSHDNFDIVDWIYLRIPGLSLDTAFGALGEPDQFLFLSGCGFGGRVHSRLLYPSRGVEIVIDYATKSPTSQGLGKNTPISSINYFSPAKTMEHLLQSLRQDIIDSAAFDLLPSVTEADLIDEIRPWPGLDASPTPTADYCPR